MELNMSNGHNFYMDMGENATVVHGIPDLAVGRNSVSGNDVFLEVSGRGTDHFTAVDANKLRDAIDKAVGRREGDKLFSDQASIYQQVALHEVFDDCWTPASTPSADDMIEKLDRLVAEKLKPAAKPYRPIDRDRLLRHIEDVEAALARRNERWERDQSRIHDLEAEAHTLREIKDSYEEPRTVREYLDLAWENATVPEDGMVHEGEQLISRLHSGGLLVSSPKQGERVARSGRLLDPRVEPTADERRRAEYEAQGLEGWEIALLMEASMS